MSSFYNFARMAGKETLIKESISLWCSKAKKGNKIIIANPLGNYILEFKGKWKPKRIRRGDEKD